MAGALCCDGCTLPQLHLANLNLNICSKCSLNERRQWTSLRGEASRRSLGAPADAPVSMGLMSVARRAQNTG